MMSARAAARYLLWACTAGGALVWLFIVVAQPWAWWSWNLINFGWVAIYEVPFKGVAVDEDAGGVDAPLIRGPPNIWLLTMMSCLIFVAWCAAMRMALSDSRAVPDASAPAKRVITLWSGLHIKFKRAMDYQLPPHKFWLWLTGGLSGLDALVGGFFLGIDLIWLFATLMRIKVYHDTTFEDYGPNYYPVNKYTAYAALSFAWAIVPQILLIVYPVPRSCFLHWMFGTEMPRIIKYHRWLGHMMLWNVSLHGLFHYITWWCEGIWLQQAFKWDNTSYVNHLCGSVAWIVGAIIWVTSTNWVRRHYYKFFYITHCFGIMAFMLLAFMHWPPLAVYAVTGWFFYLMDLALRLVQRYLNSSTAFCTIDLKAQVLTIRLTFQKEMTVLPTQYLYIKFPTVSLYQRHPFSIASISRDAETRMVSVVLHVKALGTWTKQIQAAEGGQVPVVVEGPYGNVSFKWRTAEVLVLFAGGVGVTPILTILQDILSARAHGRPSPTHVYFIWMARNVAEFQLLPVNVLDNAASWQHNAADATSTKENGDTQENCSPQENWLQVQLCDTSKEASVPVIINSLVASTKDAIAKRPLRTFGYGYNFYCLAFLSSALGAYAALLPSQAYQAYNLRTSGYDGYSTWLAGLTYLCCLLIGTMAPPVMLAACVHAYEAVCRWMADKDTSAASTAAKQQAVPTDLPERPDVEAVASQVPGRQVPADAFVKRGRPDIPHILADIRRKHSDTLEMMVYASGPKAMWRIVRDECQATRGAPYPDCHMLSLSM